MGRPLGGSKSGGRKKGTPNKFSETLLERAASLEIDPFEFLCLVMNNSWERLNIDPECITLTMRLHAAKELCQYLYPKRKAIEVDVNTIDVNELTCTVGWADEKDTNL